MTLLGWDSDGPVDDETLAHYIYFHRQREAKERELADRATAELIRRLQRRDARELPHPTLIVALEEGSPTYDVGKLRALYEHLPAQDVDSCVTPAHEKMVPVPERWDGRKLNALVRRFGEPVKQVIESAKVPGLVKLRLSVKEK